MCFLCCLLELRYDLLLVCRDYVFGLESALYINTQFAVVQVSYVSET